MSERLDRIESILDRLAERQSQFRAEQEQWNRESNERQSRFWVEQEQWNQEWNERQSRFRVEQEQWNRESNERMTRVEGAQQALTERMDRFHLEMEQSRRDSNARMDRIEQELDENFQYIGTSLNRLTNGLDELRQQMANLGVRVDALTQASEQDRSQAAIDRAEFRSTVEQLLQVLTERFTRNGDS